LNGNNRSSRTCKISTNKFPTYKDRAAKFADEFGVNQSDALVILITIEAKIQLNAYLNETSSG
jgi:hypothetical protein